MLILNSSQVRQALPAADAVRAMQQAFLAISAGQITMPVRTHLDFADRQGTTLVMPACVRVEDRESLAIKVVSVFANNPQRGLPRILAVVNVFDPQTGQPIAILEGTTLTEIRTAAASAAATEALARPCSDTMAVIGAGVQARSHIEAICCVRPIRKIHVSSRTRDSAERLVNEIRVNYPDQQFEVFDNADDAITAADIVCTVSTSSQPLFQPASIQPGTHINAVGSYQPHVVEIPGQVVRQARVFVDHRQSALDEAGDLIQPLEAGLISADHILGEIGQVIGGSLDGRTDESQITLFKSVGNAVEDCLAASGAIQGAQQRGLGTEIPW